MLTIKQQRSLVRVGMQNNQNALYELLNIKISTGIVIKLFFKNMQTIDNDYKIILIYPNGDIVKL